MPNVAVDFTHHCLLELVEYNVSKDGAPGKVESLCGEEVRAMNDMERIDALLTRKIQIARFLAPLVSAIYDFPSVVGVLIFFLFKYYC